MVGASREKTGGPTALTTAGEQVLQKVIPPTMRRPAAGQYLVILAVLVIAIVFLMVDKPGAWAGGATVAEAA